MIKKRTKFYILLGSMPLIIGTLSHSFAFITKGVNDLTFTVHSEPQYTLRFYTAHNGSSWSTYTDLLVAEGNSPSLSNIPAPTLSGYTFKGWNSNVLSLTNYSITHSSSDISNLTINSDLTFYPILESNSNFAYTDSTFYEADVDVTISSNSISSTTLGKRYAGINGIPNPIADWNSSRNLLTSSGIYKFVNEGGGANLYRKVGFKPNSNWISDWDGDTPTFGIHTWQDADTSSVFLGNNLVNGIVYGYIPATYSNFLFIRNSPSKTQFDWNGVGNQSGNMAFGDSFVDSTSYSSTTPILEMDNAVWDNWTSSNTKWVSN